MSDSEWSFPHCPQPPNWRFDWPDIEAAFEEVRHLATCPQDPIYHAEGDVLTHTRMVCEALVASESWKALPDQDREIVFAATLLHDVAKPTCTQEENGRLTSRGHAARGARMTRCLLWRIWPASVSPSFFAFREAIVGIVRHHGLPLYFLDRPDPRRALIEAATIARLDHVAIMAEADVRGRICDDQTSLLDAVAMFRDFAAEQGCLDRPFTFPSDHTRFLYFRKPELSPEVPMFDDSRCEVTLMSGLPASGKDHWLREHPECGPVIALDSIRDELDIDPTETQGAVANAGRERAKAFLRKGQSFAWNATNTTRMLRRQLVDLFTGYRARVRIVYLEASPEDVRRRNDARRDPVPTAVIDRLRQRLEVPDLTEATSIQYVLET